MTAPKKPLVVVVGSLHYDIMVDAPDRPRKGETVTGYAWRPKFGGKGGNQAVAAAKAGAEVRMAGAVGADEFGRFLLDALGTGGVDASRVARLPNAGSGLSVAIADARDLQDLGANAFLRGRAMRAEARESIGGGDCAERCSRLQEVAAIDAGREQTLVIPNPHLILPLSLRRPCDRAAVIDKRPKTRPQPRRRPVSASNGWTAAASGVSATVLRVICPSRDMGSGSGVG